MYDQETLIVMATAFEKQEKWKEIIKIYYHALDSGLSSEPLGELTMKAIAKSTSEGQAK